MMTIMNCNKKNDIFGHLLQMEIYLFMVLSGDSLSNDHFPLSINSVQFIRRLHFIQMDRKFLIKGSPFHFEMRAIHCQL